MDWRRRREPAPDFEERIKRPGSRRARPLMPVAAEDWVPSLFGSVYMHIKNPRLTEANRGFTCARKGT
ncbi:hypothetical protein GCM10010038_17040 [Glutamicibacter protophormiae]|nr:hypothetical protein GCM10010038_17040 [Glutamicibacter protophormiae]